MFTRLIIKGIITRSKQFETTVINRKFTNKSFAINNIITFFEFHFSIEKLLKKKKTTFSLLKISHCSLEWHFILFYFLFRRLTSSFQPTKFPLRRIGNSYEINNFQTDVLPMSFYLAGIIQTRASTTPYTKHVHTSNATVCKKNEPLNGPPTHPYP